MMRGRSGFPRFLFLIAAAVAALPALCAGEERTLLTPDGTLHTIRSGRAADLGVQDSAISPDANVIAWTSTGQDGTASAAVIPGTETRYAKRGLQLAFDDQTDTLLLLWTEDMPPLSQIRVGVLREGKWTNSGLLPSQGLSGAYNPQMLVTHQAVSYLDENDDTVAKTSSILSIIWWEEAQYGQARFASLFLDEDAFDPSNLTIYDLPLLTGGVAGPTSSDGIPNGAYLFPSLLPDGLSGAVLASFADLHDRHHKVVRISFPADRGKPSDSGSVQWKRRHIPIVGVAMQGPVARVTPMLAYNAPGEAAVGTTIGSGYRPTLYWHDGAALKFTRLQSDGWAPVRAITIDDAMPYDKALGLVVGMGQRN